MLTYCMLYRLAHQPVLPTSIHGPLTDSVQPPFSTTFGISQAVQINQQLYESIMLMNGHERPTQTFSDQLGVYDGPEPATERTLF